MRRLTVVAPLVVVAVGVGALGLALGARTKAQSRLEATLERHRVGGMGGSLADLGVAAPAGLDPARQQAAWEWMREAPKATNPPGVATDSSWFVRGDAPPPKALAWYGENRAMFERLFALMRSGPTHLGAVVDVLGLPGARDPDGDEFRRFTTARIPNLLAVRHATLWLRLRAFLEDDPSAALHDLDHLHAALRPCTTVIEAMVMMAQEAMRDEACLALALRGRLPLSHLVSWSDAPPEVQTWVADSFRAERLGIVVPMARDLLAGADLGARIGDPRRGFLGLDRIWERTVLPFWRAPDDAAAILDRYSAVERWMREGSAPPTADTRVLGWPFETMLLDGPAFALPAVGLRTEQRAARVLALLAPGGRADATWPADDAAARARLGPRARLLEAGPFALALRYEHEEDGATRVIADASAPRHASLDGLDLSVSSLLPPAAAAKRLPAVPASPSRPAPPSAALRVFGYGIEVRAP